MSRFFKSAAFPILLVILLAFFVQNLFYGSKATTEPTFNDFQTAVQNQNVANVVVKTRDLVVTGNFKDGKQQKFQIGFTQGYDMQSYLLNNHVSFTTDIQKTSVWWSLLGTFAPILIMIIFFVFLMNQMQGGGNKVMSFGKSRAKRLSVDQPKITFKDVAGVDEAVEELGEIKEFLENPKRFQSLGARIPKGVLLFGPPGTGKTLLARAVAGEAGVPFFSISGSDFVEMFVGVGASRVRDLFDQAKQNQPCIIFIDEIDAVGRHRGAGLGGGHDEREQTLNQLLVEMDGFEANESIIIMAATNRPDILDPALLRPGRFDRQIVVDRPDREGRRAILDVHARGKPLAPGVDVDVLAAQTPGFTGRRPGEPGERGALLAARRRKRLIEMEEFEEAVLRVIAGPEKKSRILSDEEKLITAYHETGHALVAHYLPNADPVHKISIISRGQALGYTITLPTEDKFMVKKKEILDKLSHMLAGRVAEEIRFDDITTGASNDLQRATETARRMTTQYGMSESLGPLDVRPRSGSAVRGPRLRHGPGILGRDRAEDRRGDPPGYRRSLRHRPSHPRGAPGRTGHGLRAVDGERDHRPRGVRGAAVRSGARGGLQAQGRGAGSQGSRKQARPAPAQATGAGDHGARRSRSHNRGRHAHGFCPRRIAVRGPRWTARRSSREYA